MKKYIIFRALLPAVLLIQAAGICAQITSSPYSIFGLGLTDGNGTGTANGLGGTGIALIPGHSINLINPAAGAGMDTLVSMTEIGFLGKYTSYNTSGKNQTLLDANFNYAAMGLRIKPNFTVTSGIAPYSTIGYKINVPTGIEGTTNLYTKTYTGQGGVNKLFVSNSLRLTRHLLIGVNVAYLFGSVTHAESSEDFQYSYQSTSYLSNLDLNWGLIWQSGTKYSGYSIGLTYDNGKRLTTNRTTTLATSDLTEVTNEKEKGYSIPRSAGTGFSFWHNNISGGFDFETRQWRNIEFDNPQLRTRNSRRYSAGLEIPSGGNSRGSAHMVFYRLGAQYCESYMIIKGAPINYRSISLGLGIPAKGYLSVFNFSVELGRNGTLNNGLFRETFCTLHADISLKDLWFMKRRYN